MTETRDELLRQIEELKIRLQESEETLEAIRSGEVDALVVTGQAGEQIFTLKGADETYRTIVETMSEGAAIIDKDGTVLYANGQLSDLLRVPLSRLIGSAFSGFVRNGNGRRLDSFLGGPSQKAEFLLAGDGDLTVPVLLSASPLVTDGRVATCLVITDLTERKRAEDELREAHDTLERKVEERTKALKDSEERFRSLYENSLDGIMLTIPDGKVLSANRRLCEMLGMTEEEILAAGRNGLVVDDEKLASALEERARTGKFRRELSYIRKDGSVFPVEAANTVFQDAAGRTLTSHVIRDITDQKAAEQALRASEEEIRKALETARSNEEQLRVLMENVGSAVALVDDTGRFSIVNRAFLEIFGLGEGSDILNVNNQDWSRWEVYGEDLRLLDVDDHPVRKAAMTGKAVTGRLVAMRNPGANELTWMLVNAEPLLREDGSVHTVICTYYNITQRRAAEEAVRRARDELELRVQERTTELRQAYDKLIEEVKGREHVEAQLRQAQKMEALGVLAGGIAHDFNNILAAVIGFSEIAKDRLPRDSKVQHQLDRVLTAGMRGRELVRHMLTFSRETEQEKKPLPLSSIVKETAKLLRASIPTTIGIRTEVKNESGYVFADPTQMQQVVMNLCTNAAHAMQEKGGTLQVELSDFSVSAGSGDPHGIKPGLYTRLTVRDTGSGIDPGIIDRIFDPFFTTKKPGEGTGLGLSVVDGIVRQHGGYVTVESAPGKGSTFNVYLPKVTEETPEEATTGEAIPTGCERVLFVDDEEALIEMGQDVLEELGYTVTVKKSSLDALLAVKESPSAFDLVITDQTMPDMTGVELAVKVLELRPDMPIILCTGFSHLVDADRAQEAGIKAFAMKPLTKREIAKTIREVLDA